MVSHTLSGRGFLLEAHLIKSTKLPIRRLVHKESQLTLMENNVSLQHDADACRSKVPPTVEFKV